MEVIVTTIEGQPENVWAVIETDAEGVHVLPWDGNLDMPVAGHEARQLCGCRPTPKRDAPLDEPVWSHHEPGFPGSSDFIS